MSPWNFVQCRYIYFSIKGDDEEKEEEEEEEKYMVVHLYIRN
jgi:hypothetical protein